MSDEDEGLESAGYRILEQYIEHNGKEIPVYSYTGIRDKVEEARSKGKSVEPLVRVSDVIDLMKEVYSQERSDCAFGNGSSRRAVIYFMDLLRRRLEQVTTSNEK